MTFKERQAAVKEEQKGMSHDEVMDLMEGRSEYAIDLNSLKPQKHIWVDRGMVISCEGAGHPNHRHFKRR